MKMAALMLARAAELNSTAVLVIPWFGSPPPHRATSKISEPWKISWEDESRKLDTNL